MEKSVGFIGGGRITKIMLGGFQRAGKLPRNIIVSDNNEAVLRSLRNEFPGIATALNDNAAPSAQDLVFLALHPPAMGALLSEIKSVLKSDTIVISLAPKLSIAKLSELLGGFQRIARSIPNAPSLVNKGYNPITFSSMLSREETTELKKIFGYLGECPVEEEKTLEAYAIVSAMGPTYLWFQLYELLALAEAFGISRNSAANAIKYMVHGAADVMTDSGLSADQVMDLVPVKPLAEDETLVRELYRKKLSSLHQKLTGGA